MQNIPLHLLEALIAVSENDNLIKAAASLGVTQPTLTRQLQKLEELLPSPLFTNVGRKKRLSQYGVELCDSIKGRMSLIPAAVDLVNSRYADPRNADIRIVGRREILAPYLTQLKFEGSLSFDFMTGPEVIEEILMKRAQIGVTQRLPDSAEIIAKPLFKRGYVLAVPKNFSKTPPSFGSKALREILTERPGVAFSATFDVLQGVMRELNIGESELHLVRRCSDWTALSQMVLEKMGWAVLPQSVFVPGSSLWEVELPAKIRKEMTFNILYPKDMAGITWFKNFVKSWPR
jgi:DNA-binding transcriptional LysR family regulator